MIVNPFLVKNYSSQTTGYPEVLVWQSQNKISLQCVNCFISKNKQGMCNDAHLSISFGVIVMGLRQIKMYEKLLK